MPADTLLGAVYQRFLDTVELAAAVPGSPYLDEAPEQTALPYVIVEHGGEVPTDFTFEREYLEEGKFTLKVYHTGLATAEAIGTLIKAVFDEEPLMITDAVSVRLVRTNYQVHLDRMRSSLTQRVTEVSISYESQVEKTV